MGSASTGCFGRCHLVPRGRAHNSEQPLEHQASTGRLFQALPGAALLSVLSLPRKSLKERCNYARESAALGYDNRRGE